MEHQDTNMRKCIPAEERLAVTKKMYVYIWILFIVKMKNTLIIFYAVQKNWSHVFQTKTFLPEALWKISYLKQYRWTNKLWFSYKNNLTLGSMGKTISYDIQTKIIKAFHTIDPLFYCQSDTSESAESFETGDVTFTWGSWTVTFA